MKEDFCWKYTYTYKYNNPSFFLSKTKTTWCRYCIHQFIHVTVQSECIIWGASHRSTDTANYGTQVRTWLQVGTEMATLPMHNMHITA